MTDKQDLGELLRQALDDIDEIGGSERHLLAQTIGRPTYDALVSKAKGETQSVVGLTLPGKLRRQRPGHLLCKLLELPTSRNWSLVSSER